MRKRRQLLDLYPLCGGVKFTPSLKFSPYKGRFILPGILRISLGYQLNDGTVVTNAEEIDVTITEDETAGEEAAPTLDAATEITPSEVVEEPSVE